MSGCVLLIIVYEWVATGGKSGSGRIDTPCQICSMIEVSHAMIASRSQAISHGLVKTLMDPRVSLLGDDFVPLRLPLAGSKLCYSCTPLTSIGNTDASSFGNEQGRSLMYIIISIEPKTGV